MPFEQAFTLLSRPMHQGLVSDPEFTKCVQEKIITKTCESSSKLSGFRSTTSLFCSKNKQQASGKSRRESR